MTNPQRIIALAAEPHINIQPGLIVLFLSENLTFGLASSTAATGSCFLQQQQKNLPSTKQQADKISNQLVKKVEHLAAKQDKYLCHELLETETKAEGE